jgi:hypothetical protein
VSAAAQVELKVDERKPLPPAVSFAHCRMSCSVDIHCRDLSPLLPPPRAWWCAMSKPSGSDRGKAMEEDAASVYQEEDAARVYWYWYNGTPYASSQAPPTPPPPLPPPFAQPHGCARKSPTATRARATQKVGPRKKLLQMSINISYTLVS